MPPTRDPNVTAPAGERGRRVVVHRAQLLQALGRARAGRSDVAVVHLDLDRFHQVNTRWGQRAGDGVLRAVAERLATRVPPGASVARVEGDSFLVLLPDTAGPAARVIADVLVEAVREPIVVDGVRLTLGASAGLATVGPGDSGEATEQAFLACRRAKEVARGGVVAYERALGAEAARRQRTEDGLRHAIAEDELRLHVQPKVDLRDGRVVGVEALVRWQHPTDGLLGPGAFMAEAESSGLMTSIGSWVLSEAISLAGRWRTARAGAPMRIWVNLAAQQLRQGSPLVDQVRQAIEQGLVSAQSLGFEVTESTLLEDLPAAVEVLSSLRELGFEIALDDFGTGYSSLSYLRRLPVTVVKIDQSFVAGIGGSLADQAIVEAVVDLAHALGLRVVAEGIEDHAQLDALVRMGADQAQGYLFARPQPPAEVEALFERPWCGVAVPHVLHGRGDARADELPGFGSPRARLLLAALEAAHDSVVVTAATPAPGSFGPPIVYVNAAFESETGFTARDVVGSDISVLLAQPVADDVQAWFSRAHAEVRAGTTEVPSRRADGSTFLCELTLSPLRDERGIHTHWLHVRRDLTQRLAAEGDRARFEGLIEQSTSLVLIAEAGGRWVYANAAMRRAVGLGLDEPLDGVTSRSMLLPEHEQRFRVEVLPELERSGTWSGETTLRHRVTGGSTEVAVDVQMVEDPLRPGTRVFAAVCRDIGPLRELERVTARRRELEAYAAGVAQQALDRGRDRLLADVDPLLGELGQLLGADLAYLDVVDRAAGVLRPVGGWSSARFRQRAEPPREIPLDRLRHWIAHLESTAVLPGQADDETPAPWQEEIGEVFPGQPIGANVYAPLRVAGELLGVLGIGRVDPDHRWPDDEVATLQRVADTLANLVSRQRAEDELRTSEHRASAMLASVSDVLVVIDREGWVRYANPRVATLGYAPCDLVGRHFLDVVEPEDCALAIDRFTQTVAGVGEQLPVTELRVMAADGTRVWYDLDTSGIDDPVVGGYMVSLRDVSVQRASADSAERRAMLEQVVLEVSQWGLLVEADDVVDGLVRQLELLGRALGADAAFVGLLDGDSIRNVAGWASRDALPRSYDLPDDHPVPELVRRYRTLEPLVVEDIDRHHEAWADEWRAFPVPDRSGLNVPLVASGRCLGNLGVSMNASPRAWTTDEVAVVRRVSETVSAVLARREVETSLRTSEVRLAALLDGSLDLVVVVAADGTIRYANGSVERELGWRRDQLVGHSVADVVHPDDLALALERLSSLMAGDPTPSVVVRLVAASGEVTSWEVISGVTPDPIAGGRVLTCRNVTERLETELEAARRVEQLTYAFEVAQAALDLGEDEFTGRLHAVCRRIAEMLRVEFVYMDQIDERAGTLTNIGSWVGGEGIQTVHPDDVLPLDELPRWVERLRSGEVVRVRDATACDEPWALEKRGVLGAEGGLVAIPMTAAGELLGVVGMSMSRSPREWTEDEVTFLRILAETITHVLERSRLDRALRESEARFRTLSETAADVVVLVDAHGTISYVSPSSAGLLGWTPAELVGRSAASIVHPDHLPRQFELPERLADGLPLVSELELVRADGSRVWVAQSTSVVLDPVTGRPTEYRASVRDITDRKRLEAELERQALHDPLTGLGNRILLRSRLEVATARRGDPNHVSVLLLDLDGFKDVNDTYGHAVGDDVLRTVAARLSSLTRPVDTLARTGGDEFVLLCPETDAIGGLTIGERIVGAIGEPIVATAGSVTAEVHLGVSVGVAHRAGDAIEPDALLIDADHAMYTAKRAGRNCVRVSR